jgi:hypothetical protein
VYTQDEKGRREKKRKEIDHTYVASGCVKQEAFHSLRRCISDRRNKENLQKDLVGEMLVHASSRALEKEMIKLPLVA